MKGATADPCEKTIRPPKRTIIMSMGRSQNFFRTRIKSQSSEKKDIIDTYNLKRVKIDSSWILGLVQVVHG